MLTINCLVYHQQEIVSEPYGNPDGCL